MQSILNKILKDKYLLIAIMLLIIGAVLRFYNFEGFITFLGDQGRDAVVMKRILTFEHFPAIGASMSVGGLYLGPFYYYFMAPWLLLFNFNPVGPAFGVALFSILFIVITYLIVTDLFNKKTGLIAAILVTFCAVLIEFSRFSWNPNLLPLFSLLSVYLLIKGFKVRKINYFVLSGICFGISTQLHYLALMLGFPFVILFLIEFIKHFKKWPIVLTQAFSMLGGFFFISIPLIIFDLRHNFLNARSFIALLSDNSKQSSNKITALLDVTQQLLSTVLHINIPLWVAIIPFILLIGIGIIFRKNMNVFYFILTTVFLSVGLSLYGGSRYPHYFLTLIPLYLISISFVLAELFKTNLLKPIVVLMVGIFIYLNAQGYYYFTNQPNNQIKMARHIAEEIYNNSQEEKISVTSLPLNYSALPARYFLELKGKTPVEQNSIERSKELFVTCETDCKPQGDPAWDIAYFAPNKLLKKWHVENVTIYKFIH